MAGIVRKDKVQIEIEINGEPVKRTLGDMEKAYRKLRGEIKHLEQGSDAFNKKAKEIKLLEKELGKTRKAARGLGDEQGNMFSKGFAGFSKMKGAMGSLPGLFQTIGAGVTTALGPIGLLIGAITAIVNAGAALFKITEEFQKMREEVNKFTGLTGQALSDVNSQITAISKTFDQEFNTVLQTGAANAKVFGSEMTETLDLIEKGLIATGSQGDEFLEQIKEYGPVLKQAGLDQEEAYAVISSGIVDGAFQDKIPDAIKEFNIRIKDLSKGQREALEQTLGTDFTDKIVSGIKTGETTSIEALNQIGGKLGELGADSSEAQVIISNLFGGPGEDVGADFIIGLQNIKGSMDEVVDTSNIYIQRQIEQLELEKQVTAEQEKLSVEMDGVGNSFSKAWKIIKIFTFQGLAVAIRWVKNLKDNFKIMKVQIVESFNGPLGSISNFVNGLIDAVNAVNKVLGLKEIEDVDFKINVEVSSEDLKKELQEKVAAERAAFAKQQELETMINAKKQAEIERLTKLREQKKTLAAEAKLTAAEQKKRAELYAKVEAEISNLKVQVMQQGFDKEIALARLQTDQKKAALKGSTEQIATQQQLLEEQYIEKVKQIKKKAAEDELKDKKAQRKQQADATKKQYEGELKSLDLLMKEEQALRTSEAVKRLEAGEDEKDVQEDLKSDLLQIEMNYLLDKVQLENKFGLNSVLTKEQIEKLKLEATLNRLKKEGEAEAEAEENEPDPEGKILEGLKKASRFINQVAELNDAALAADLAKIEAKKKKELDAVGNNEAEKRRIEQKYSDQKQAAEEKAAKKQKAISITQTIINTAESIVRTGAELGYPLAIPFQVLAAAIGAKQIQTISAQAFEEGGATVQRSGDNYYYQGQRLQQRKSFAPGGHVAQGAIGVIGEKGREWVAPNWMVTSGKYAPIIQQLENVRIRGFAVGGSTTPTDTAVNAQNATASNDAIIEELKMLRQAVMVKKYITVWSEKEALMNAEVYQAWQQRSSTGGI